MTPRLPLPVLLRPALEQRLSLPKYDDVWISVKTAFANQDWEDERDYWDYALGLRDSWANSATSPARKVENSVAKISMLARSLSNRINGYSKEITTLKGQHQFELCSFMADDLIRFADSLEEPRSPTEAMMSRPRSMALPTAERTYLARALTHFLLSCTQVSGKPIPGRDSVVAMTVCALLDIGENGEFDGKDVSDLTEDIVAHYRTNEEQ
jgi:hypothetical protein